ncbi:signal peptidase I [Thalassotalea sp. G2M2-11]|uniref:signal peptidase I n=1 Tax=Thalassotalea sp. G2M2-11 TaxID=2787627 RepID=UPI0019CFD2A8|nr:signal peptidase I [Thalassotalea sp. G2M2-11]
MKHQLNKIFQANKSFITFLLLMLVFRSAIADWNDVPTGSMKPTIVEGDRILINKLAYDVKTPFINHSLIELAKPKVNDIIIFESDIAQKRLVKRVIGIPGDTVAMHNNRLIINNTAASYQPLESNDNYLVLLETINGQSHKIQLSPQNTQLSSFDAVTVPEDHYLVLGDNRNNSADSRVIGFVPKAEIIGKSNKVVFSLDYDHYWLPRNERFLTSL